MVLQKSSGGSSSNGNGDGSDKVVSENGDGTVTYQDPLDLYCDDNPETDECRYALLTCKTCRHLHWTDMLLYTWHVSLHMACDVKVQHPVIPNLVLRVFMKSVRHVVKVP